MENPCKILLFGDSITKGIYPVLVHLLNKKFSGYQINVINAGVCGETSRDAKNRITNLLNISPNVVIIGFGMNDWRKGVSVSEFKTNISYFIDKFELIGTRVILLTVIPSKENLFFGYNKQTDLYSSAIRDLSLIKRVKIADANKIWKRKIQPIGLGLKDELHPNERGNKLLCSALIHILERQYTTILWQYNSREAICNYKCPYCYYAGLHNTHDMFFGTIGQWRKSIKNSFGNQNLYFYLGFGEPMLGSSFYDVVGMIEAEPNWELRIISNLSLPFDKLLDTRLAKDKRLHVVGSFHPLSVNIESYIKKLKLLRNNGIETPTVYVMYPPFIKRFETDFETFRKHNFLVHVRRFQGFYKGKEYPYAYTENERCFIAKYSDDGMIKYMLNQQHNSGSLTYSGLHFFIMDNVGNIGYDSNLFFPYTKYRCIFGNIHQNNFRPLFEPGPYIGFREGTDDGIANLVDANYGELVDNHVLSFAKQGGVYHTEKGVFYKNLETDFTDSRIRASYNFPSRNFKDAYYLMPKLLNQKKQQYFTLISSGLYSVAFKKLVKESVIDRKIISRFT